MHVRVAQSQHLFSHCVTAGQKLHVRLYECATALTLTFLPCLAEAGIHSMPAAHACITSWKTIQSFTSCTHNPSCPFMQCYFYYFFVLDVLCQSVLDQYTLRDSVGFYSSQFLLLELGCFGFWFILPDFCRGNTKGDLTHLLVHLLTSHPFPFFPFYVLLLVTPIGEFSGVYLSMHWFYFYSLDSSLLSKLHS